MSGCCGGRRAPVAGGDSGGQLSYPDGRLLRATPDARHLATQRGVDLTQVQGTGRDGLIRLEDVQEYLRRQSA